MSDRKGQKRGTETASSTEPSFEGGAYGLRALEGGMGDLARGTWTFFHEIPAIGGMVYAGVGIAAALTVGVGELAVGALLGYVGYRIFAYGESTTEALQKTIRLEEGKLSDEDLKKPVSK